LENRTVPSIEHLYDTKLTDGSLLLRESRVIAKLLLDNTEDWRKVLVIDNVLQKKTPSSATRQGCLIRTRLQTMPPAILHLIAEGNTEVARQATFAAILKKHRLVKDFMEWVVKPHHQAFEKKLAPKDWERFLAECEALDPCVKNWGPASRMKLREVVHRILAEVGYLENTRNLNLCPLTFNPQLADALIKAGEDSILKCKEVL
jgi:hypothetical protein